MKALNGASDALSLKKRPAGEREEVASQNSDELKPEQKRQRKNDNKILAGADSEMGNDLERDEEQMIKEVEEMIKVKQIENSALKMGYNEADYHYERKEYPNCTLEYITPAGWKPTEKFVKPKEWPKQYKFKLDKFQEKAVECI